MGFGTRSAHLLLIARSNNRSGKMRAGEFQLHPEEIAEIDYYSAAVTKAKVASQLAESRVRF